MQKEYTKRIREQRKIETGSTYDKDHYERYKHLHHASDVRYHNKEKTGEDRLRRVSNKNPGGETRTTNC